MNINSEDKFTPPQPEGKIHRLLKDSVKSLLPGVGSLLEIFIDSGYQERLQAWMNEVAIELERISQFREEYSWEKLAENDTFLSTVIRCYHVAARNHQAKKREYLKNVVVNSASYTSASDLMEIFVRYIDELTLDQIILLKNMADNPDIIGIPDSFKTLYTRYNREVATTSYPIEVFTMYLNDFKSKGFLDIDPNYVNPNYPPMSISPHSGSKMPNIIIFDMTKEFLDFIMKTPTPE